MANNSFSAGDLSLSIGTVADDTLKKLDLLAERLSFIEGSLKNISGTARQTTKSPRGRGNSDSAHKKLLNIGKWGIVVASARRLGRFMGNIVQAGSDYTETLNLWQVAMRENLDVADEFINKMSKAYGISSKTLMNAQATFKNMIGSLGQISDSTAYALSEALVQMSADFSSLYNVTLESAFEKMKSMLAGQVRPIRSAGLDMTETTLYMFYQQIGGTKTMRQLNRTEKQLLSILAVYQQMGSAGALGDMTKTLNQFANQSRMMTEYWAELKAWTGLILKDWLDQNKVLIYINAALITMTEIIKAIAKSKGLGDENFLTGMFETVKDTTDAVDELQGKLLDFDKFRALEDASGGDIGVDQKLLEAITGYSSKIDNAKNVANELATEWLSILGFTKNTNGEFEITKNKLKDIQNKISSVYGIVASISAFVFAQRSFKTTWLSGIVALFAYGYASNEKFRDSINRLMPPLLTLLNAVVDILPSIISLLTPIVEFSANFVVFLDDVGLLEPLLWGILSALVTIKALKLKDGLVRFAYQFDGLLTQLKEMPLILKKADKGLLTTKSNVTLLQGALATLSVAFLAASFTKFVNTEMSSAKRMKTMFVAVGGAILAAAIALHLFEKNYAMAISAAALVAGGVFTVSSAIPNFENGASDIDSGTVFRAGEFGKTEMVYNGTNGKTNVANVQQMQQAMYNALVAYGRTEGNGGKPIVVYLDGEKVYENTTAHAKQRGNVWSHA